MTAHPALRPELVRRLRAAVGGPADTRAPAPPPVPARGTPSSRFKQLLRPIVRRAVGWYIDPALQATLADVRHIVDEIDDQSGPLAASVDIELLKAELAALESRIDALEARGSGRERGDG